MANITGRRVIFVNLQANTDPTIKVANDSGYTINLEHIAKSGIINFKAVYNAQPGAAYPYPTQTMATVILHDNKSWSFELQDVDNGTHPTWRTGDQAACVAFENALAASIPI